MLPFQTENVHAVIAQALFLVEFGAPDAVGIVGLVEEDLAVQPAELCGRIDVEHEQAAGGQGVIDAAEGLPAVGGLRHVVEAVERADDGVDRLCQTQALHGLTDEKRAVFWQGLCLLLRLRQHVGGEVRADDPIPAPCQQQRQRARAAGQIQNGIEQSRNELMLYRHAPRFVGAGQSTQMIIGATPETDNQLLQVAEGLYRQFGLKRVFYSAFVNVNEDRNLPATTAGPPLLREHRLYQADWLLRFYGFQASEILDETHPNLNVLLDPKEDWAVRNLQYFPVEVNRADYHTLLRVPGIGVKSAQRIVRARRSALLRFEDLKKIGVTMKRAVYFITCNGRMLYPTKLEEDYLVRQLTEPGARQQFGTDGMSYRQMSLFDDYSVQIPSGKEILQKAVGGQF